jgi:hypothetical protein
MSDTKPMSYMPHPFDVMRCLAKKFCSTCPGNPERETGDTCEACPVENAMKGE